VLLANKKQFPTTKVFAHLTQTYLFIIIKMKKALDKFDLLQ